MITQRQKKRQSYRCVEADVQTRINCFNKSRMSQRNVSWMISASQQAQIARSTGVNACETIIQSVWRRLGSANSPAKNHTFEDICVQRLFLRPICTAISGVNGELYPLLNAQTQTFCLLLIFIPTSHPSSTCSLKGYALLPCTTGAGSY